MLLWLFLRSRPPGQRTMLHSLQLVLVYSLVGHALRLYVVSTAATFASSTIKTMMDTTYGFDIILLVTKPPLLFLSGSICALSFCKLLLVISPVAIQNFNSKKGFWVTLAMLSLLFMSDMIGNILKCGLLVITDDEPSLGADFIKFELNILEESYLANINETLGFTGDRNEHLPKKCHLLPTNFTVYFLAIVFEVARLLYNIYKEHKKTINQLKTVNSLQLSQGNNARKIELATAPHSLAQYSRDLPNLNHSLPSTSTMASVPSDPESSIVHPLPKLIAVSILAPKDKETNQNHTCQISGDAHLIEGHKSQDQAHTIEDRANTSEECHNKIGDHIQDQSYSTEVQSQTVVHNSNIFKYISIFFCRK